MRVSLINGVTSGLMGISRAFAKTHGDAVALNKQLDLIKGRLMVGGALAATGLFGLSLIEKTIPAARDYAHQIQQMNVAGMKQVEIAKAVKAAWGAASEVPTSGATENLKAIRELRMVFGDTQHAITNMPTVQKLQAILQNTSNGHGGNLADQAYTVAKALEMRGATLSPQMFNQQSDMMTKAVIASGGKVTPQDFLNNIIYGRRAAYGWDNTFTYSILPTLIQEMKGGGSGGARGPGNALMSAYAAVVGGVVPQKSLKVWSDLGLIDRSKVEWTKAGEMKGVRPGGITGADIFQANPYAWAQQVLVPAMQRKGITDPAQIRQTMQYLFPNRTASIMDQMVTQAWKFQRDQRLINGAQGLSAYATLAKRDPFMAQQAMEAQWTNVKTQLGLVVLPMLIQGTIKLTAGLTALSNAMQKHPTLTKALVGGFVALSAAMAFGGTVILLSAAFGAISLAMPVVAAGVSGLVAVLGGALGAISLPIIATVAGIAAVGAALWQVVKHWDTTKGVVDNIKTELGMFFGWIGSKVQWLLSWLPVGMRPATAADVAVAAGNPLSSKLTPGQSIFDLTPKALSPNAAHGRAESGGSRYVAPAKAAPMVQVQTSVQLKGREIAKAVSTHVGKALGANQAGPARHDPNSTLASVASGYGR